MALTDVITTSRQRKPKPPLTPEQQLALLGRKDPLAAYRAADPLAAYRAPDPLGSYRGYGLTDVITANEQAGSKPAVPALKPPGPAPDLTDRLVREARTAQLLRLQMGKGRRNQFLTGPGGAPSPFTSGLLGG
jgi:hypothetical protein